jgi:hypothetical protein
MSIATKFVPPKTGLVSWRRSREARAPRPKVGGIPARTRRELFRAVLLAMSGLLALTAFGLSARAGGTHVLVIPIDDGYGLSDCLTENAACGPMVASAWCKAKGHGASGTLSPVAAGATASDVPAPRGFTIICQE